MAQTCEISGRPAAPGIACGPLVRLGEEQHFTAPPRGSADAGELARAIATARDELAALQAGVQEAEAAEILEFQIAMLEDQSLGEPVLAAIAEGVPADRAWDSILTQQIAEYAQASDEYFRARASDLRDIRDRVLRHLRGVNASGVIPPGAIFIGEDMAPSRFLETDWSRGGGLILTAGSPTSHVAMLARSRGVPMVVGLDRVDLDAHHSAAVDGATGRVILSPGRSDWLRFTEMAARGALARSGKDERVYIAAMTADGHRILVKLNIADVRELDHLDPAICDGIGLVRTELLFNGESLPDEDEQYVAYQRILLWANGRPVTIRTLDAGGDKPIKDLTPRGESNPFLGLRGIRLSLARPDIFAVQLRALCRAAVYGNLRIMLPMVTVPEELVSARALLHDNLADLKSRGVPAALPSLGIMVEVPAAALAVERFDAAFFSIGSNDLIQYTTASARDIGSVAALANPENPAVLRLISDIALHGERLGREVSVCGDMAGDPRYVPTLLKLGISCLSMAPICVGAVKAAIAEVAIKQ